MKKRNLIYVVALVALSMSLIVACGKNDGGGAQSIPPEALAPVQFTGGKIGFYAQNTAMNYLLPNNGSSFSAASGMIDVLKFAMRTCDRAHYNGGTTSQTNCQSWLNGPSDIMIFSNAVQANSVQMVIRASPNTQCTNPYSCSSYWVSMPSFSQFILGLFGFNSFNNSNIYNPMILNMTIWPINNSKGFELRGNAPGYDLYYNSGGLLFQFIVREGKLSDLSWNYELIFNGKTAASGRMVRCASQNCGVAGY
jgi:hypothetical protein